MRAALIVVDRAKLARALQRAAERMSRERAAELIAGHPDQPAPGGFHILANHLAEELELEPGAILVE